MSFLEQLENIYAIDTNMFDMPKYMSAYIVKGKEIVLVDTGMPNQLEVVRANIKATGVSISDISYILITHEHGDHMGNVAPLLRESPNASVYATPTAAKELINPPTDEHAIKIELYRPDHALRRGVQEPVSPERIKYLKDGDVFDLGNGEKLRVIFAPGHKPGGVVFVEENNRGMFINDLVGNYFADCGAHYTLNASGVNHIQGIETLKKLIDIPVKYLYLGHYGIVDKPREVMERAIDNKQKMLDIGRKYVKEGKPELIAEKAFEFLLPQLEKLKARSETVYTYATRDHVGRQVKIFAQWCQENLKN